MGKIKSSNRVTNERIGENRTFLNTILCRKANRIGHILRINCLLYDAIEGQMTEVRGIIYRHACTSVTSGTFFPRWIQFGK